VDGIFLLLSLLSLLLLLLELELSLFAGPVGLLETLEATFDNVVFDAGVVIIIAIAVCLFVIYSLYIYL
jgi:hypothetical protein